MKAVLLAAGRGKRFGEVTQTTPKCLLPVAGRPILLHLLENLPAQVSEIIVVLGHLGDQIQRSLGDAYRGRGIRYCLMAPLTGTAGALWSARPYLTGRFLVLNGDDIIGAPDLLRLISYPWAWGIQERPCPRGAYWSMKVDTNGDIAGYVPGAPGREGVVACLSTGSFVLGTEIFDLEPVQMKNGEYGLPHTLVQLLGRFHFKAVPIRQWLPVNTPAELQLAQRAFDPLC